MIIGIDPGANGAICALYGLGNVYNTKMPDTPKDILLTLKYLKDEAIKANESIVCYLEDVGHGMPGQSSSATAKFARHNGHVEMALIAEEIKTIKVTPQKWQRSYSNTLGKSSGVEKNVWKNKLKALAQDLFPSIKITLWNADALLISEYGKRNEK